MTSQYRATFTSGPRNVTLARKSVAGFARVCGFSEAEVADIGVAAGEAISNAVEHACGPRANSFTVQCTFCDNVLTVAVADSGKGFRSPPDRPTVEPDERGRGFGIFLMRRLMDDVTFARDGTLVRMVRRQQSNPGEKPKS